VLSILLLILKRRKVIDILLRRNSKIVLLFIEEGRSIDDPTYMKVIDLNKKEKDVLDQVHNFMVDVGVLK
jgi:hypothetical protein